jgi:NAD(P)-dependent dehydrogenase (short-subunit alcohol dehydrogenase family)
MRPAADHGEESYRGLGRLQGRVALITGGDSGIGRAVAIAFAREGADVAFGYLDEHEDARETLRQIEAAGRRGLSRAGDLADPAECERLVDEAFAKLGRVDVLVHNAAFQRQAVERFEEIDPPGLERTFRVNVLAAFHLVRRALPRLKPGASIITVSSIQAYEPSPPILDYASTKGALVTFTKGLAKELAGRGIRVNSVAPGPVWTPLVVQSFDAEKNAKFGENAPLGRPAQPAELAPAFVFLACDESTYVTGEVLGVTGGRTLA